jgi:phage terminase large subunit GpA-like protein
MAKRRAPKDDFVRWIERTIRLPIGLAAEPGKIKLPVYLRAIAAAMDDPAVGRITVQKSARVGFSTLLMALVARHFVDSTAGAINNATQADTRETAATFIASPNLLSANGRAAMLPCHSRTVPPLNR